ncbi:MAG TPA: hypothetical protein VF573_05980 [Paraburkholderia sp.]|uniref:hypothetical protein n=1 Tax=Paraburkholderia sp. TaxID=1926495 RepID=UPI002ED5EC3A
MEEICAGLLSVETAPSLLARISVRLPGKSLPAQWRVTDLFKNIESLQRCLKEEIHGYFGTGAATVEVHVRAHETVERTFHAIIESAIEARMQRQAAEVSAAQAGLQRTLTALQATQERLRVATSAAGQIREGIIPSRQQHDVVIADLFDGL